MLGAIEPQVKPVGSGVSDRATSPAKPFRSMRVIVEDAESPMLTREGEEAVMLKSGTFVKLKVAVALWANEPLVPVTVTG